MLPSVPALSLGENSLTFSLQYEQHFHFLIIYLFIYLMQVLPWNCLERQRDVPIA